MVAVLLPGLDGTGSLFRWFVEKLPASVTPRVIRYSPQVPSTYHELETQVFKQLPSYEMYILIAESYSGPLAALLGARAKPNLQAIVLVASFVQPIGGPTKLLRPWLFKLRPPRWFLRRLLLGSCSTDVLETLEEAIATVSPRVLATRFQNASKATVGEALARCSCRVVYLLPSRDLLLGERGLRGVLTARPGTEVLHCPGPHLLLQCNPSDAVRILERAGLLQGEVT
jgi:pimeloyl-ACP methyl ester carboxylesterase